MKEVMSSGDGVGRGSLMRAPSAAVVGGLPRPKVCLSVANFVVAVLVGVTGRLECAERLGLVIALLKVGEPGVILFRAGGVFFFDPANVRRNDHSDSNCTVSNSFDSGEYSNKDASNNESTRRSAKRMMKTEPTCREKM